MAEPPSIVEPTRPQDFIREIVANDLKEGRHGRRVNTRFPPEPNGYLHIGHAKSICLNFGVAEEFGGLCNLRFDDTNPTKEDVEYVDAIKEDVAWLGFNWTQLLFASDYFEKIYEFAVQLIRQGQAIAGSPETVRAFLAEQIEQTGANYIVGQFCFGDLSFEEMLHSVELFAGKVMPALREQTTRRQTNKVDQI